MNIYNFREDFFSRKIQFVFRIFSRIFQNFYFLKRKSVFRVDFSCISDSLSLLEHE